MTRALPCSAQTATAFLQTHTAPAVMTPLPAGANIQINWLHNSATAASMRLTQNNLTKPIK
jgi:hypothetical protein